MTTSITIPTRMKSIEAHKDQGGLTAAVFPIHYPKALFRAHGILPVEVWGPPLADPSPADAHLPSYTCSVIRHSMAYLLSGKLDITDMLVVPHCCDTLQGFGSILLDFVPQQKPVLTFYLPRGIRKIDIEFLADELRALNERLSAISGKTPTHEELSAAIKTEQAALKATQDLFDQRLFLKETNREFFELTRSREYLPAEQFTTLAEQALAGKGDSALSGQIPILLSGILSEPMTLFDTLTETGAVVVADDLLNSGRRHYARSQHQDPFIRMAEMIVLGPPDSTTGSLFEKRVPYLIDRVAASQAKGVIFYYVKFCEPEAFYLPALKKGLEKADIPSIVLEVEIGEPLSNQIVTRLQAFMEILS